MIMMFHNTIYHNEAAELYTSYNWYLIKKRWVKYVNSLLLNCRLGIVKGIHFSAGAPPGTKKQHQEQDSEDAACHAPLKKSQ